MFILYLGAEKRLYNFLDWLRSFNDCTKLLLNPKTSNLSYVERQIPNEKDMVYSFSLNGAPKELHKKIVIFQNFKKYFEEEIKSDKEKEEKE